MPGLSPVRFLQNRSDAFHNVPSARPHLLVRLITSASLLLLSTSLMARADDTLTLELPPSPEAMALRSAERAQQAANRIPEIPAALRAPTKRPNRQAQSYAASSRGTLPSRGQSGGGRVVGRLGQVERQAAIYRGQSSRSARLSSAPAGTYLAIQAEEGNWYGILMSDGTLGWLKRDSVHLLEYQVVSDSPTSSSSQSFTGDFNDGLPAGKSVYFHGDPQALFREAYKYLGVPYHWGGNTASGIDCSGFVKNVFETCGYPLPRHSSDQTAYGVAVPKEALEPGDRLYFGNPSARSVTHCGLYLGNGYFIHSSSNRHGVAISQLGESLYERMYVCARR